jgi:UDP-perosamine 4-acetyltransferase
MHKIVVLGGGGHAKVIVSILRKMGTWNVLGYTDNIDRGSILGAACLGNDQVLVEIIQKHVECNLVIGVGSVRSAEKRIRIWDFIEPLGFKIPSIISPNGIVNEGVSVGSGTVVFDGSIINTGTIVGSGAIINSNATVEHDCRIADFVHIAPGATICGGVTIGRNSLIGAGSIIVQGLAIAENCIVGAGATVVEDCTVPGTYLGTPARRIP